MSVVKPMYKNSAKGTSAGNDADVGSTEGEPTEAKKPRRAQAPAPRLIIWGARRGTADGVG